MSTITVNDAKAEMFRRSLPKSDPRRAHVDGDMDAPLASYATTPAFGLGGADLAAIAGRAKAQAKVAQAKAPAKKAPKKPARKVDPHTALRKQAWDWRAEQYKAGVKVTVDQAYAKFGTHRAG